MNIRCLTLVWETYSDSSAKRLIAGRRKKLHFAELRRIERTCSPRARTVTGFKLLIEWQRSLTDGCHSSKGENEWQSGSVTTESRSEEHTSELQSRGLISYAVF